jgi:NAD(P)-dependent dehydrogenase (short-subunit alcohol dehydrogenase family)
MNGRDSNHIEYKTVPKDPNWLFVGPQFHALHHVYPDRYMSSVVKIFDWVAGTAYSLRNKNIAITGGSGAFGSAIQRQLRAEGVRNIYMLKFGTHWTHHDFSHAGPALDKADILILAHGTKGKDAMDSNCNSAIRLVQLYLERRVGREECKNTMPEIWYIGSEIELHPAFGASDMQRYSASKRAFLPYARALYDHPNIIYRHIVPAAFNSPMGKAFASPEWAASVMMWWIRRGARYIPVTYTGIAYLNYVKFIGWVRPGLDEVAGINKAN